MRNQIILSTFVDVTFGSIANVNKWLKTINRKPQVHIDEICYEVDLIEFIDTENTIAYAIGIKFTDDTHKFVDEMKLTEITELMCDIAHLKA